MKSLNVWTGLLLVSLAGCGGGQEAGAEAAPLVGALQVVSPLLDDEGGLYPTPDALLPADPSARTRRASYAHPAQADQLRQALGERVAVVEAGDGEPGWHGVAAAVRQVQGHHEAHQLGPEAPVLVRGGDLRLAAVVADELVAAGLTRVFLVTRG
ncbi:MAG: hypothetical protein EKK53_10905 [Burkholderiales bacterium]|nr:MAG: hypothetical protein EKK53_10905 [Burkholderiales bacterium]